MSREAATNANYERAKLPWQFCAAFLLSFVASGTFGQSSPCDANFNVGGSVVRGTTYTSVDEYRGAFKSSVMAALKQALTDQSFTFTEPDKTADSFVATGSIGGREAQEVTFTVTPFPGGTRLSFHHRLGIGTRGRDETVQQDLCQILGKITPILREKVLNAATRSDATDSGAKLSIGAEAAQGRNLRRGHPADYLELRPGASKRSRAATR